MKIVLVMVSSVNGKITRGDNPDVTAFASKEDAKLFVTMKENAKLIIMGRITYEVARAKMKLNPDTLRVVMTKNPEQYDGVVGQLEFTSEPPTEIVARLSKYPSALLVGGGQINALFLKEHLVNEIHLTIEPWILGKGKQLIDEIETDAKLSLISVEKLNDRGTLHLIYSVL